MRRLFLALSVLSLVYAPARGLAQPTPEEEEEMALDPAAEETEASEETDPYAEEEDPSLREAEAEAAPEEPAEEEEEEATTPSEAPAGDPSRLTWTAPQTALTLHGYMRTRAEIYRNFNVGRGSDATDDDLAGFPFRYWLPLDRGASVAGGCSGPITDSTPAGCYASSSKFRTANMRLRLQPTIAVSDDIRVHMLVDAFDNLVLGSTPSSLNAGATVTGLTLDSFAYTQNPALAGRNSFQNSIYVRRAWAEIHARDMGQLWFGRMPNHWGLGMLFNDGAGIDGDFSSDVDRIMGIVQIQGFQLAAAWDFANQGAVTYPGAFNGVPFDASQRDDVRQATFIAAHRLDPEEQRRRLARGDVVVNGGLYFQYRTQNLSSDRMSGDEMLPSHRYYDPNPNAEPFLFTRRNATTFTLDGWAQLLWGDLRVELETALVVGKLGNATIGIEPSEPRRSRILQGGYALQFEYRALDRRLGIYFDQGLASGDPTLASEGGLSIREDQVTQTGGRRARITQFSFHPNYRIDLILMRNILGSVSGVTYFRPGISYDIRRTDHGQVVGVRADAVYSRATVSSQAYGPSGNLGLELDGSIYYRSELGPDLLDGFYVIANYGLLFPFKGLGYDYDQDGVTDGVRDRLAKAQTFRLILGVQF